MANTTTARTRRPADWRSVLHAPEWTRTAHGTYQHADGRRVVVDNRGEGIHGFTRYQGTERITPRCRVEFWQDIAEWATAPATCAHISHRFARRGEYDVPAADTRQGLTVDGVTEPCPVLEFQAGRRYRVTTRNDIGEEYTHAAITFRGYATPDRAGHNAALFTGGRSRYRIPREEIIGAALA